MEVSRETLRKLKKALLALVAESMMEQMVKLKLKSEAITEGLVGRSVSDKETQKALYRAVELNKIFFKLVEDLKIVMGAEVVGEKLREDGIVSNGYALVKLKGVNDRLYFVLPVSQLFEFDFKDAEDSLFLTIEGVTRGNPFFLSFLNCKEGEQVPCIIDGKVVKKTVEFIV
jgi:hypothetical protein